MTRLGKAHAIHLIYPRRRAPRMLAPMSMASLSRLSGGKVGNVPDLFGEPLTLPT